MRNNKEKLRNDGRVEEKGKTQIEEMKIEEVGRKKKRKKGRRRKRKWKVLREKKKKNGDEAGGEEEAKNMMKNENHLIRLLG